MEDAHFDPGSVDASAIDIGRMLLVSFATVYGNDWFTVPIPLPVGTLSRVTRFTVTDVFGRPVQIGRAGEADDGWNLFGLTDLTTAKEIELERPTVPWFFFAPALVDWLEGPPIERVELMRDERLNLAWAVETTVADDAGGVLDRAARESARPRPEIAPSSTPRYRVQTTVPSNWYPLAPEKVDDFESIRLRLVALIAPRQDGGPQRDPIGWLLAHGPEGGLVLQEQELPRAGVHLMRPRGRGAPAHDGSVHTWTSRTKRTGGGEGSSGLRFDIVEP
jgi:hypothetical protein